MEEKEGARAMSRETGRISGSVSMQKSQMHPVGKRSFVGRWGSVQHNVVDGPLSVQPSQRIWTGLKGRDPSFISQVSESGCRSTRYFFSPRASVGYQFPRCLGFERLGKEVPLPIFASERPKQGELLSGFDSFRGHVLAQTMS